MRNNKLLNLALMAMLSASAFTAQVASAKEEGCYDWNDYELRCFPKPSGKTSDSNMAEAPCAERILHDSICPVKSSGNKPEGNVKGSSPGSSMTCDIFDIHDNSSTC